MKDIVTGTAVVSKAGRDKGRYFAVVGLEENFAFIADGTLRKLEKPKRKKLMHLGVTNTVFAQSELSSDKALKKAIVDRFYGVDRQKEG